MSLLQACQAGPLYRAYKYPIVDHFYTPWKGEMDNAVRSVGYTAEGITGRIFPCQVPGSVPLFRMWHPGLLDHFYTTSEPERSKATSTLGYKLEDLPGYVYPAPKEGETVCPDPTTKPLYRMYKYPNADHFYTMDAVERDQAISSKGYNDEGIAACIPPA